MAVEWRNWAGDQRCRPAAIEAPSSRAALVATVQRAAEAGRGVRVSGAGHSFTEAALTDGVMLRLDRLDRVLDVDRQSGRVRAEGGITLRALNDALERHGLAMENLGDIDRQTLAGAISTGTHGTGAGLRNISAQVDGIELVAADGTMRELTAAGEPDLLRAARVGVGALGAIYSVTLRAVPAFTLHRVDSPRPISETLASIDELGAQNDHFEFFVFPYTERALLIERNRTDQPPRPRGRFNAYLNEIVIENHAMDLLARFGRRFPRTIPRLVNLAARSFSHTEKRDSSYRIFANERRVRFTEMEYGIPREHGPDAVRRVLDLVRRREIAVGFPIEFRLVAADDAFLSPSSERDTAYIAVHQYRGMVWRPYFEAVEDIMNDYDGRPHWGKRHFQTAETLRTRYPRWEDFQGARAELDPDGVFSNEYTDRVLGPIGARV
jgi:FAD-linked oxidoreductase